MSPTTFVRRFLILLLTCIFLVYLENSVSKYNSSMVSVSVRELQQTSFEFPTVAVCGIVAGLKPEAIFDPVGSFPPWIEWVEHDYIEEQKNVQLREEPNTTRAYYMYGVERTTSDKMWLDDVVIIDKSGLNAGCNFFRPPRERKTLPGVRNRIALKLNNGMIFKWTPFYFVVINHPDLLMSFPYLRNDVFQLPAFIDRENETGTYHEMVFHIDFGEYTQLSRPEKPCRTEKELETIPRDNFKECAERYITAMAPECLKQVPENCTEKELKTYGRLFDNVGQIGEMEFLKELNCYPPCHVPTYDVKMMPTISNIPSPNGEPGVQLSLYASRPAVTQRVEFLVFDGGALAGDLGGLMGMLMGASILALFDYLVGVMGMTKKYMISKNKSCIFDL